MTLAKYQLEIWEKAQEELWLARLYGKILPGHLRFEGVSDVFVANSVSVRVPFSVCPADACYIFWLFESLFRRMRPPHLRIAGPVGSGWEGNPIRPRGSEGE